MTCIEVMPDATQMNSAKDSTHPVLVNELKQIWKEEFEVNLSDDQVKELSLCLTQYGELLAKINITVQRGEENEKLHHQ